MREAYFNWSGGKDSTLALHHVLQGNQLKIHSLLTTINQQFGRISMHGVREELLELQAESIGIPLNKLYLPEHPSMEDYEQLMSDKLDEIKGYGLNDTVFGDIFLEDLKSYREQKLAEKGIKAHFPIWKRDTKELIHEFIDLGYKTIVVCINNKLLDESFCGRVIDHDFVKDLPDNVDPCGENGEFHTFVFDGPILKKPIPIKIGEKVFRKYTAPNKKDPDYGFWFCDLTL